MWESNHSRIRIWPLSVLIVVASLVLTLRLVQLTVVEGTWRRMVADENRIFTLQITAQRGILTDRNGIPLTQNSPLYRRQVPGTNPAQLQFEPVEREVALTLLTDPDERIRHDVLRNYPCGMACAPIVGYVSETSLVGAERAFDRLLQGIPGEEYLEINARGKAVRSVGTKEPQSGTNVRTTIDLGLQQTLYQAFGEMAGAAVALDPDTGEILAMVSAPTFDPSNLAQSLVAPGLPFFNRALSGTYAPGSTFKMVTALAALEEEKITGNTAFEDTGELTIGDYRFGNWLFDEHGRTEGSVSLVRALARSNDIYFYKIGELVGPDKLAEWGGLMGFGKTWGLQAWGEAAGLVPTPAWKQEKKGERWFLGNTYHMSIGQGDVLATPLQVALMTAAIAARGVVCPPHFVIDEKSTACQQLNLHETSIQLIQEGMIQACAPGGTGSPFFAFSPQVACKTGTAQQGDKEALPHAWFTVYAPAENPTIALTVLVEKGGQGSTVAGPIAKAALEYWLKK